MTVNEYLDVGYIRSNCLNKTVDLFKGTTVTTLTIERSQQERGKIDSPHPWIKYYLTGLGHFILDWDIWKHKTSFDNVIKILSDFKTKYQLSDFVVEKIQIGLKDPELITMLNNHPRIKNKIKNEQVFVTFRNTPLAYTTLVFDGQSDLIQRINLNAIVNLKFKKGVLDLKNVHIMNGKNSEQYDFMVHETDFIERVLHNLHTDGWYQLPEIKEIPEHPSPCAIRTYEMKQGSKWSFVKDREIR